MHDPLPSAIEAPGFFSGLELRPIVFGALVDYLASLLGGGLLFAVLAYEAGFDPGKQPSPEAIQALLATPQGMRGALLVGVLGTLLGGFLGARRARREFARHGAFVGLVSLSLAVMTLALETAPPTTPLWYDLLGAALVIPVGALGGALAGMLAKQRGESGNQGTGA